MKIFRGLPLASDSHQFFLVPGAGNRSRDGWFEVSWLPNWTDADGDNAKFIRRRLRGRWIRIELATRPGIRIFRRLSFCGSAAVDVQGGRGSTAVHLSWDDRIALYDESVVRQQSAPVELKLTVPNFLDWAHILTRIPREGSEGAVVGLVSLVLAITGLLVAATSVQWPGLRSSAVLIKEKVNSKDSAPGAALAPVLVTQPSPAAAVLQRWSLFGGDKGELVVRSIGEAGASRGLSVECDASEDQQLVLQIDAKIQAGSWTLRADDGEQAPNYLPLRNHPACQVTGSKHYRFLIYTDDTGSAISVKDITIRPATDADDELPLVWPTSGPRLERYQQRRAAQWIAHFGVGGSDSEIAQAQILASWVHAHSRVVGLTAPRHVSLRSPRDYKEGSSKTIDGDCAVFSNALLEACAHCGIICRPVYLGTQRFEKGEDLGDTHALVEVFDKKQSRWLLVDPTFNVVFESGDGRMLGIAELIALSQGGGNWKSKQIGPSLPSRSLEEYYLPIGKLLWLADAPAVPSLGGIGAEYRSRAQTVGEVVRAKYTTLGGP